MLRPMNETKSLDDLRLFLSVARRSSFADAARREAMPTSTLSRRIAALEASLGTRLLQRTSRSVVLTHEGAQLVERTGALLDSLESAFSGAGDAPAGTLRVTAPVVSGAERIAPALFAFVERYPAVKLELQLTNALVDVFDERIDLAFRVGPIADSRLVARRLWRSPFVLAASPAFIRRELGQRTTVGRDELERLPAVVNRPSPWRLLRKGRVEELRPHVRVQVNDPRVGMDAAMRGLGVLCAQEELVRRAGSRLQRLTVKGATFEPRELFAVFPSRSLMPARVRMALDAVVRATAVA